MLTKVKKPLFHEAVAAWFEAAFAAPTAAQADAWPAIKAGRNVLIAAPTGSGKTLAAFMAAIDDLVRQGIAGALPDETQVVYVSPLKALSNDINKNLELPLAGIREVLRERGLPDVEIRTVVRTGDTPSPERERMRRKPPHIVVTTPESLYVLLGSESGRKMLATTRSVIVDEIHAIAGNKRGTHLAVSLERLSALCGDRLVRIGLSATVKPIEPVAHFLVGVGHGKCQIIDTGHQRARDLAIDIPGAPLEAVMSLDTWGEIYQRLAELIAEHRTTLIFVNTRRLSERVTRALSDLLGEDPLPRITEASPRKNGSTPSSASNAASCERWSRRRRWSSASTSATSISCARSARRARSRRSCSGSGGPGTRSTERPRDACFRSRVTTSWSAPRCSTVCAVASSTP